MTKYRHASVDGIKVFYREDGPANAPGYSFCFTVFPHRHTCFAI